MSNKLNKVQLAMLDQDVQDKFSGYDKSLSDIATNVKSLGAKGDYYLSDGSVNPNPTDDTTAFQTALDKKGRVIVPSGTYLVGGLIIHSNTQLIGIGKVTLKYKSGSGYASPFGTVMIANENLPTYHSPSDINRQTLYNLANNITIKNLTLDMQNSTTCGGIQLVCVDYANVKDVFINNGREALDLQAIRYSTFTRVYCDNIGEDVISVTDQHFAAPTGAVHHGISRDLLFDTCRVTNSCFKNGTSQTASMNAFEMDDGMQYVTFRDCVAMNNSGSGFDTHVHTSEYDMEDIKYINCHSINNLPPVGSSASVSQVNGFTVGQCPQGSTYKNITFENCVTTGCHRAFNSNPGAELGYKENITIIGGHWENNYPYDGTVNSDNVVISLKKQFRSFKIIGANIVGCTDSYAFYSYGTGDGLKISNVSIKGSYIPLGLTHTGGRLELSNISIDVTNPSNALSSIFISAECDDVVVNGIIAKMDASKYSSHIIRIISTKKNSISALVIENTGVLGNNCVQFDTVGMATLTGCNLKNFTNAVYFSNTSTSIVSVGNNFKGCTNKYNSTPAYLVDSGNAL